MKHTTKKQDAALLLGLLAEATTPRKAVSKLRSAPQKQTPASPRSGEPFLDFLIRDLRVCTAALSRINRMSRLHPHLFQEVHSGVLALFGEEVELARRALKAAARASESKGSAKRK